MTRTTVFAARRIITMNPAQPVATHVAVRDGRILSVGSLDRMHAWGDFDLDTRFADKVLMPGLVEGHSHLVAGGLWRFPFVGMHPRTAPDGKVWPGCRNFDEVVARLREADARMADPVAPLLAWGFDPIYFGNDRMTIEHLDRVSVTRPVIILHASFHVMNVNSAALSAADITNDTEVDGVVRLEDGRPAGELREFAAMFPILRLIEKIFRITAASEEGLLMFGRIAQLAGVTTATDLVNDLSEDNVRLLREVTARPDFPVRLVPAFSALDNPTTREAGAAHVKRCAAMNTEKLHFGAVKIITDGAIQSLTARMRWPGYFNGHENGIWNQPPSELKAAIAFYHSMGLQLHIHTNGDEAIELALDGIAEALAASPRPDHRHTLQHCQMADAAQFRRMARLGVCANLFANHIYYWGDVHYALTMGPDRAERIDACATALAHGVPLAIHSDAPVTPLGPIFTAWCAVNRRTSSGRVLGASECISVEDALRAITLGAAFTLGLDDRIGSIEVRKFADFCVLDDDPLATDPAALKDLRVAGTVLGGQVLERPGSIDS